MTSYLLSAKEMPFTARDIRELLNLRDDRFDNTITAKIGSTVIMAECKWKVCLRPQTWAIQRIPGSPLGEFFKAAHRIGKIAHVGPAYEIGSNPGVFHDVTFAPDYRRLDHIKASIVNWCWDEFDIGRVILRERRGEFRLEWPTRSLDSVREGSEHQMSAAE